MSAEALVVACVALPAAGAALLPAFRRRPNLREAVTILTSFGLFAAVCALVRAWWSGARPDVVLFEPVAGAAVALRPEPLGLLFLLVASGLWIVTSFYAIGYVRAHHEPAQTRFFACFALAISATMGIALSRNLLTLFLFYELLTFSTWPLVTHHRNDAARRAGRVYLGVLVGTSVLLLLSAVLLTAYFAGTTEFRPGGILAGKVSSGTATLLFALFAFGTGKAALMPFHRWLPAAMVAPTPVSALLHAVAVVKAGVFTVMKVAVYVFGLDFLAENGAARPVLLAATASVLLASLVAMTRDNLKERLAYSTVSQLGYVTLGAALADRLGVLGGAMHIAMHAVGKITLFFCAGAVFLALHETEISRMRGIGRKMPFTMAAFLLASLSIVGLPPLGGSWSKLYLLWGSLDAGQALVAAALGLSSLLNVWYLTSIPLRAFLLEPPEDLHAPERGIKEAPLLCVVPLVLTALGSIALFVEPRPLLALLSRLPLGGAS